MYAFLFVEVLPGFLNMADFPPNLEDGEQWLPTDIYHEIVYGSFEPKALADNTGEEGATEVWNELIILLSSFHICPTFPPLLFTFFLR